MKFGQLILRKIIKIVSTRCEILRLKCTKFETQLSLAAVAVSSAAGEAYSSPQTP